MEDGLKILKVKYLSNPWSDLTLLLNLNLGEQNTIEIYLKEDNLQWKTILKVEYISNPCSDLNLILNLSLGDQTKIEWWL